MEVKMSMQEFKELENTSKNYRKLVSKLERLMRVDTEVDEDNIVVYSELSVDQSALLDIAEKFCRDFSFFKDDISRIYIR